MRPTLKAITITYEIDGHTCQKDVDLGRTIALFWEEKSMTEILGAFYKSKGRKLTLKQAVEGFGPGAAVLFKKRGKRAVTKKLLRDLWNVAKPHPVPAAESTFPQGEHPGVPHALMIQNLDVEPVCMGKDPECPPQGYP